MLHTTQIQGRRRSPMLPSHLTRAIRILQLLQAHNDLALQEIARRIHCSQRTVYRDLDLLRQCGFRIAYREASGGYHLEPLTCLPHAPITANDLLMILGAIQPSSGQATVDERGELFRSLTKLITSCVPESHPLGMLLIRTFLHDSSPTPLPLQQIPMAASLLYSLHLNRDVEISWQEQHEVQRMRIRVSNLELRDGQWYATVSVRNESGSEATRTLRVDLDQIRSISSGGVLEKQTDGDGSATGRLMRPRSDQFST